MKIVEAKIEIDENLWLHVNGQKFGFASSEFSDYSNVAWVNAENAKAASEAIDWCMKNVDIED